MQVTFLQPLEQFDGTRRMLGELKAALGADEFDEFRFAVAFAKSGPLVKLRADLEEWRRKGKRSYALFGVDFLGTTKQALELALELFDEVYVTHVGGACTFHPKLYIVNGPTAARILYGSHNLTTGGLETNFEGGVCLDFELPADAALFDQGLASWKSLLPDQFAGTRQLTPQLLQDMVAAEMVLDETEARIVAAVRSKKSQPQTGQAPTPKASANLFPRLRPRPASPRPSVSTKSRKTSSPQPSTSSATPPVQPAAPQPSPLVLPAVGSDTLVIQINPHENGEVFLSKLAVEQNRPFFGFPFTGLSIPKKGGNKPYPQRDPDPVVNILVYDAQGKQAYEKLNYNLNTVFYDTKSEIRVTISPDLRTQVLPFSILVMRQSNLPNVDYEMEIYNPGSVDYDAYLVVCNQTMPSGGSAQPRKFGWL